MKNITTHPFVDGSPAPAHRRSAERRHAMDLSAAVVFAVGLFTLIALLDGAAGPGDPLSGTAYAATLPSRPLVPVEVETPETWSADTSAEGTRPDAIH